MAQFDYKVHVDESGNDPNLPCFVHAGYLSPVERWEELTAEWVACLSEWGIVDGFHMTEAEALDHGYSAWDRDLMQSRVLRLAQIVERHTTFGVACDMQWSDWRVIVDRARRTQVKELAKLSSNPYLASLHFFIAGVANKCDDEGIAHKDVGIVLAEKGKVFRREDIAIGRLCEAFGFQRPTFQLASDLAPLQAADMLAWSIFQSCSRPKKYLPMPDRHKPLVKRVFLHRITAEDLNMPIMKFKFSLLSPQEAATAKPVGTLTKENVQGLTFYMEGEDAEETEPG